MAKSQKIDFTTYPIGDISKLEQKLGWKPQISPREGVSKLVGWISENKQLFS